LTGPLAVSINGDVDFGQQLNRIGAAGKFSETAAVNPRSGGRLLSKRVAVVGAGPAGLVTVKELLAEGHASICFEREDGPGGVFRFDETRGVVWESCRLTSSPLLTAFSDFPIPADPLKHLKATDYVTYLSAYCDAFGLRDHLRFGTTVEAVSPCPTGGWTIRARDAEGTREEHFDSVALCSGLHQHPHIPMFPGQDTFTGETIHAANYRRPSQVRGKRVLIVGAGESGADVAAEVAANAAETVLSLRRGVAVLPRTIFGKPQDLQTSRLQNSAAHWIFQTRNPADDHKRQVYRWLFLPFVFVDKFIQLTFRFFWEFLPLLWAPSISAARSNLRTRKLTIRLLKISGGTLNEQFGTKTDDFVRDLAEGRSRQAPAIVRFDGPRVVFQDQSEFTPDLVIFCTGFDTRLPYLDEALASAPRFLNTFNQEAGASLGFIGFVRPALGAIPPLAELQARWFALIQSGRLTLPDPVEMHRSIDQWTSMRAHIFRAVKGRLQHLVDFTPFCDELASRIGCKPNWRDIRQESRAFRRRFVAGPFVAAQYRLVGPHAKPEIARHTIENLPMVVPLPYFLNLHLRWALSRAIHRLLGPAYVPKLELEQ
jgi:dimethylaniline monooxygenase (N-oxide forming)